MCTNLHETITPTMSNPAKKKTTVSIPSNCCAGCCELIKDKKTALVCGTCTLSYDLLCANVSLQSFKNMTPSKKCAWLCQQCICGKPKIGNTNTPVRGGSPNILQEAVADRDSMNFDLPEESNVTLRRGTKETLDFASLTLEIRQLREDSRRSLN